MSAFASMVHADGAHLFTDGAVWNLDQTLLAIRTKVALSKSGRVAVSAKGDAELGTTTALEICALADLLGAEAALGEGLQSYADILRDRLGVIDGVQALHVLVVGLVEGQGGKHCTFRSFDDAGRHAYQVETPAQSVYYSGSRFAPSDIKKFGLDRLPGEPDFDFIRRLGGGILDVMRYRPGCLEVGGPHDKYFIGGKIDCTTIVAGKAWTETLIEYPDEVGKVIDPYRFMPRAERKRIQKLVA